MLGYLSASGFALIAWPADYGASGVQTFIVNQDGVVFQKDLGESPSNCAGQVKREKPTSSHHPFHDPTCKPKSRHVKDEMPDTSVQERMRDKLPPAALLDALAAHLATRKFDLRELSQLLVDSNLPLAPTPQSSRGMATGEVTLPLLTA
jgi:hypothetical protein